MTQKQTGGPAFPHNGVERGGMTLRDYFAGQALAGDMANEAEGVFGNDVSDNYLIKRAGFLFRMADAMIAARDAQ